MVGRRLRSRRAREVLPVEERPDMAIWMPRWGGEGDILGVCVVGL